MPCQQLLVPRELPLQNFRMLASHEDGERGRGQGGGRQMSPFPLESILTLQALGQTAYFFLSRLSRCTRRQAGMLWCSGGDGGGARQTMEAVSDG